MNTNYMKTNKSLVFNTAGSQHFMIQSSQMNFRIPILQLYFQVRAGGLFVRFAPNTPQYLGHTKLIRCFSGWPDKIGSTEKFYDNH